MPIYRHAVAGFMGLALLSNSSMAFTATPQSAPVPESSVAVSNAPMGQFPYVSWSDADFAPQNTPVDQKFGHFLFWNGQDLREVEGQTFLVTLTAKTGHFNEYLMRRTVEDGLARMGGVRLTSSRIPAGVLQTISNTDKQSLGAGFGDMYNDPVQTWLIRRADGDVWIQYTDNSAQASLAVVQGKVRN